MKSVLTPKAVIGIEVAIMITLTGAGFFAPQGWQVWFAALFQGFGMVVVPTIAAAAALTWYAERRTDRLQGPRKLSKLIGRGIRDTAISGWVAACLLAWPLARINA